MNRGQAIALVIGCFLFFLIEIRDPYYFSQDDNFAQFLPVILQSCRGFFRGEGIPLWNPFQFLGAPTFIVGTYALSYPITYVSYAIARWILLDEFATLEVFAFLHLFGGILVTHTLLSRVTQNRALPIAGTVCFIFSGYNLIAGRSWYYMLPGCVWVPLLFYMLWILPYTRNLFRWTLLFGGSLALYFHSGNAQMWIYAVIFLGIFCTAEFCFGRYNFRKIAALFLGAILGIAGSLPLLIPQMDFMKSISRDGGVPHGIGVGILSTLIPYPLVQNQLPTAWGSLFSETLGTFYFSGSVFIIGSFFLVASALFLMRQHGSTPLMLSLLIVLSFYFGWGSNSAWSFFTSLPVFEKFNHPFKFLFFINLFTVIGGVYFFGNFFSKPWTSRVVAATGLLLISWNTLCARGSFYSYGEDPYPQFNKDGLDEFIRSRIRGVRWSRMLSVAPERSIYGGYTESLTHNFSSVYGAFNLFGYDPLIEKTDENLKAGSLLDLDTPRAFSEYGVRWVFKNALPNRRPQNPNRHMRAIEEAQTFPGSLFDRLKSSAKFVKNFSNVKVFELGEAKPLSFFSQTPEEAVPIRATVQGVEISISPADVTRELIVNFLMRPQATLFVDGVETESRNDPFGRIVVPVSSGAKQVRIYFNKGIQQSLLISLGAITILVLLTAVAFTKRRT